jgi:protein SCO1
MLGPLLLAPALLLAGCGAAGAEDTRLRGEASATERDRPDFRLQTTEGQSYDFAERTAGRPTLLFFGYTSCPDICPTTLADVSTALGMLDPGEREQLEVVVVTTDPGRDTPEVLADYLRRFDPGFVGLTGTAEQVRAAQERAGVGVATATDSSGRELSVPQELLPEGYVVDHASAVTAYGSGDTEVVSWRPGTLPEDYAADLSRILQEDR